VDLGTSEVGSALEELGRDDDNRRGAIADLCVLQLCQLYQDLHKKG
jgi:hypothetical protein